MKLSDHWHSLRLRLRRKVLGARVCLRCSTVLMPGEAQPPFPWRCGPCAKICFSNAVVEMGRMWRMPQWARENPRGARKKAAETFVLGTRYSQRPDLADQALRVTSPYFTIAREFRPHGHVPYRGIIVAGPGSRLTTPLVRVDPAAKMIFSDSKYT